jgi:tight adherence protein C
MVAMMLTMIVALVTVSAVMMLREAKIRDANARVSRAIYGNDAEVRPLAGIGRYIHALGERVRRFYAPESIEHLRTMIQAAGHNPHRVLPVLLGCKVAFMVLTPVVAAISVFFIGPLTIRLVVMGVGIVGGIMGPELALGVIRRRFVADLQRGTPDALDLLVLCSEAGMGLESALERVSQDMRQSNRAMSSVLDNLLNDLRVLPDRSEAFDNLGNRTGVEGLRRLGIMLGQSLQYGTPLGQALRAVATELRRDRMNKLEEKAIKLPAKLIFPLIFFIMPSLYIVLLGPSFMRLYDSLRVFTMGPFMRH